MNNKFDIIGAIIIKDKITILIDVITENSGIIIITNVCVNPIFCNSFNLDFISWNIFLKKQLKTIEVKTKPNDWKKINKIFIWLLSIIKFALLFIETDIKIFKEKQNTDNNKIEM